MCKALDDLYEDGVAEGLEKGIEKGEERLGAVIQLLLNNDRADEISLVASDKNYRKSLFEEFKL